LWVRGFFQNEDGKRGGEQHADRLASDGRHHHPAAGGLGHPFGNVRPASREIDADPHADDQLADEKKHWTACNGAQRRAKRDEQHVGEHQPFAAKAVAGLSTDGRAGDCTQNDGGTD